MAEVEEKVDQKVELKSEINTFSDIVESLGEDYKIENIKANEESQALEGDVITEGNVVEGDVITEDNVVEGDVDKCDGDGENECKIELEGKGDSEVIACGDFGDQNLDEKGGNVEK